jgi:putative ABC transport system ATP-binding protein
MDHQCCRACSNNARPYATIVEPTGPPSVDEGTTAPHLLGAARVGYQDTQTSRCGSTRGTTPPWQRKASSMTTQSVIEPLTTTPVGGHPVRQSAARTVGACKVYGEGDNEVRAVDDVTVAFDSGRFSAIMGPSGSGKSTLMHCMAGLDPLTSGHAYIGESDLTTLSERQLTMLRRDKVGFIFQSYNLVPSLSALENITLPSMLAGRDPNKEWLDRVITTVGLSDRLSHKPSELSGGQQQRVAVARALVAQPEIIFADEPTGNLDSRSGTEILAFMRQAVTDLGQTIVMVTHDPVAAGYSDHIVFLADGRVVDAMEDPTAQRVLDRMRLFGA